MPTDPRLQQIATALHQAILAKAGGDAGNESVDNSQPREEAFTEYVLELLSDHNEADGVELAHYEAKGTRSAPAAKLSAWSLSGDGATADLFVVLYRGDGEVSEIGLPEARSHFQRAHGFLRRALDGFHSQMEESSDGFRVMEQIHQAKDSLTTIRLFFLTDGVVRSLDLEEEQLPGIEVRYVAWDLEKLSRLRVGHREVIELDFRNDYDGPIPCIKTADPTGEYQTFLAFLPASILARIYGEHGQRLLERNVRAFLQSKGKINRGLQKTLKEEPHRFLAYNNGLCCTAAEVRVNSGALEWVKDFQIVNGGQTTASIHHALKKEKVDVSQVMVQVKLTVLRDPAKVSEIVPLISRYANSQNKVNGADFAANGAYHQTLEQLSRSVWAPAASGLQRGAHWYYERARGSYADDKARQGTPPQRRKWEQENPPLQKFTKTDLAKYEHAWLGMPHFVCAGAEKNFNKLAERMENDGEPLVDANYFRHLVAKMILFRTAEKVFTGLDITGFRANSVAYAVAWLSERSNRRIDLERIWKEQRLTPALVNVLGVVCAKAHEHITDTGGNPGERSKKEECWKTFRDTQISLDDTWEKDWADSPILSPASEEDVLEAEWEKVRGRFLRDERTIQALESYTNREWVAKYRREGVATLAAHDWKSLKRRPGLGLKKLRVLVEMFAIAAE
ncbi:MAG: abortive phage infection protein [Verrucomicrobiales bacterium VVV1]|nr:MAG: abortive phage infection protein [Verrucomicrobiales bacterium VVV1]